ncbi:Homeobox protein tos8 [Coemansia spiralis]|nr:Homeobox protein tos8 [Coemansia spiralis]
MNYKHFASFQGQLRSSEQENMPPSPPSLPLDVNLGYFPLPPASNSIQFPATFDYHFYPDPVLLAMLGANGSGIPPPGLFAPVAAHADAQLATSHVDAQDVYGELPTFALPAPGAATPAMSYSVPPPLSDADSDAGPARTRRRRDAEFVPREVSDEAISQFRSAAYSDPGLSPDDWSRPQTSAARPRRTKRRQSAGAPAHGKCYTPYITKVLEGWVRQNLSNPYPPPQAKLDLMEQTGLTKMQLKNWFCNIRRRKLSSKIRHRKPRR